jgi:hypothetical protein
LASAERLPLSNLSLRQRLVYESICIAGLIQITKLCISVMEFIFELKPSGEVPHRHLGNVAAQT